MRIFKHISERVDDLIQVFTVAIRRLTDLHCKWVSWTYFITTMMMMQRWSYFETRINSQTVPKTMRKHAVETERDLSIQDFSFLGIIGILSLRMETE